MDADGQVWIVDWWYDQKPTDVSIDALLRLAKKHHCRRGLGESGVIQKAIEPAFKRRKRETKSRLDVTYLPSMASKVARFQSFRSLASSGKLHIYDCPWGRRLVAQLAVFPSKEHDDAVDVCSLFGRGVDELGWAIAPYIPVVDEGLKPYTWAWLTHGTEAKDEPRERYI